jgi:signal transduction histidine kinase
MHESLTGITRRIRITPAWRQGPATLRARIFWSVIPILLLLWIIDGAITLRQLWQVLDSEFAKKGEAMANNLAYSSELGVFSEDQQLLLTSLRGVVGDPDFAYVFMYGNDGRILVRAGNKVGVIGTRDWVLSVTERARLFEAKEPFSSGVVHGNAGFVEFFSPIVVDKPKSADELLIGPVREAADGGQRVIGAVRLALSLQKHHQKMIEMLWLWGGLTVLLLAISTLAIYALSRRITRPVNRLTVQAKKIAAGVLHEQIPVESRDEIGALAVTFNQMARDLERRTEEKKKALEEVRELNRTLEERVRKRTTEVEERTLALARSLEEVRAMAEISRAVSSSLDLRRVLDTIGRHAINISRSDGCAVFEYNPARAVYEVIASQKLSAPLLQAIESTPIPAEHAIIREPLQISNLASPEGFAYRDVCLREGFRAVLVVPIGDEHAARGAVLFRRKAGPFGDDAVDFLRTLARQSKVAIDNARLFQQVQRREIELKQASRHKSQFLANMSHELRTPLTGILGYTDSALDGIYGEVPDRLRDVLRHVRHNGRHLLSLINDVLDLSKIEAGQLHLVLDDYSVRQLVEVVVGALQPLAAEKQLDLTFSLPDELPPARGDERRLAQVLLNLIGNAVKFTDAGAIRVEVVLHGEMLHISVSDTGPGIPVADQKQIFEEFYQVDTSSTRTKGGAGLGLSISRRIIDMHGGRLWVQSSSGTGSTFFVTIPVRVEEQAKVA